MNDKPILVVEDNPDHLELTVLTLQEQGADKLPKLSGLDVLRSLRSNPLTALVPVVMLTSSSEQSDIIACYQSGANGFVRKPVDFGDFTEKLSRLQDYWLRVNESIAAA
ncbi:MAG: two-component system response regulator [Polaromonas sp. 16-63-31]|uniref:response regulator n=1 Tax=Polaromonas sp. 16-63-31 TaxID=1970412 RepID=UPI000BD5E0A5|nr:response regulator [Polaromonas sp. 16-63-31]OYZ19968.1 MAG: two-component system response regulator [Polaromonas sp. 16-63-31]